MSGNSAGIVPALIEYVVLLLIFSMYPYMNSRTVLFGVFLPEAARDDKLVRAMRRRYALAIWIIAAVIAAVTAILLESGYGPGDQMLIISSACIPSLLMMILYVIFRRSALRLKQERNWHVPLNTKRVASLSFPKNRMAMSHYWYLVPLAIILACAGVAAFKWDSIPHTFITHYGAGGHADRFSAKTVSSVFQMNFIQLGMLIVFLSSNVFIRHSKQSLDPNNPEQSMLKQIKLRHLISLFLWVLSLVVIGFMGVVQGSMLYGWSSGAVVSAVLLIPLVILIAMFGFVVYMRRMKLDEQSDPMIENDDFWKAGAFYYNPADPALFVSKRTGLGWTINFGQPLSWIIMIGIVLIPVITLLIGAKL